MKIATKLSKKFHPDMQTGSEEKFLELKKNYDILCAYMDSYYYSFDKENEKDNLILQLKEKRNSTFLKFGIHYDELVKSSILLNFTKNLKFKVVTSRD